MSIGITALGCAINIDRLEIFVKKTLSKLRNVLAVMKPYIEWLQYRLVLRLVFRLSPAFIFVSVIMFVNIL